MTPHVFCAHLTRALQTKTTADPLILTQTIRRAYGLVMPLANKNPDRLAQVAEAMDRTPRDRPPAWYLGALRGLLAEADQEYRERQANQRPRDMVEEP